jgi:IPT/TIG domain/PASTA domain
MSIQVQGHHSRRAPRRRRRPTQLLVAALTALCASAFLVAAAQASTISIGSVLPTTFTSTEFQQVKTLFNTTLPEKGANLVSPVNGAIVRWRVQGAAGGPFFLRILHPNGSGAYKATGTSGAAIPTNPGLQTFTTNLAVKAGDLIGIDPTSATDKIGIATEAGANYATIFPPPFDGAIVPPNTTESGKEIELSAEVQPTPAITKVSPATGPVGGGTQVTITGTDFNAASAVRFGDTPAATYQVDSEDQITATAPRLAKVANVDITVTTVAGTSAATRFDSFSYKGCEVPKLNGKSLRVAKNRLRGANCKLGKVGRVKRAAAKRGKVVLQNPKPGKVLAPGAKVNLKLGK